MNPLYIFVIERNFNFASVAKMMIMRDKMYDDK